MLLSTCILLATTLNAEYIRSIRVGSFPSKVDAENSLKEIKLFITKHENIKRLQEANDFIFKARESGAFYITLVEPFTDRVTLQEVLDTLRLEYTDIYVTKLKKKPQELISQDLEVTKPSISKIQVVQKEKEVKIVKQSIIEEVYEKESLEVQIKSIEKEIKSTVKPMQESKSSYTYQIVLVVLLIILLVLVYYLLCIKKEKEAYINKELILDEQLTQLKEDNYAKDKLLSHVSHELRTPMTAIMGLTHLVLESDLTKIQSDYIQKIESSSQHLLNLINDILDVSKIKAGELKIEKIEFNIDDILEYVLSVNVAKAKKNGVILGMDVSHEVPSKVIGDSLRLGQVLINLIGNAVKFTNNGEVTLSVKKVSSFADGLKLEFSISDTGIGMTDEQVQSVFNSYYQADESTSRKFGGTGLGLSISKELVDLMGGEIHVSSTKDVGTTFSFTANFTLKDALNQRQYRLPSSSMLEKNVLIVDSSNRNVIPLVKALGYFNYVINAIPSFEDAVLEDAMRFDIVIVNQYNLTVDAMEVIKRMRVVTQTKLVILSELHSNIDSKLIENIEVDSYIQVPCSQQSILNMIIDLYVAKNLDKRSRKTTMKDKLKAMAGKKILVAEDNEVNQKVIMGLLAQTGIELTFVDDGQEALDLVKKDIPFDLLLMDINMPNMNGYEASREIRKTSKYNNIPILALTGDVMDDAITKAMQSGMQGHIAKPIIIDIFYKKILDTLSCENKDSVDKNLIYINNSKDEDGFNELSISVGLGRCHGDVEFYKTILNDFTSMYISSAIRFEELCSAENFREARRISMDIKDVALNIGAYNLCESAATMEYEFEKGSRSNWREFVSFYDASLSKLFKDIDKYLKET
ncbi:Sensory box histidine kinase/response regulator [hydrothermal vent metagenome]|uniref:Sensory box histidine kinase/response regulator n=1 Tax=hydrothermal vent metagenome TaxID=652676 RepID=A0A1W1C3S0_9ZZZZ